GSHRANRILDGFERILNQIGQPFIGNKSAAAEVARDTDVDDVERIRADVFAILKKLVITESVGAPISPGAVSAGALFDGAERFLPLRAALDGDAFDKASAGPANECGLEVGNHLG